ncbi:MAG: DHA2 family efflux MFS transporter permease subunit, partial [Thermomicrobiaceae bacterium]|nr:DHA2 family efflux MFS transporter permease subunit [Thermomicrobiaceae bacterium]
LIMPATLSILTNVFPPAERARAIAIWSGVTGLSIPLGPVVGGWLLEHASWGAVFFVNVPVIAIALVAGFFLVPESRDPKSAPLDPLGAGLSIAGLTALLYGIIEAPSKGWTSDLILGAFGLAALLLALFALWERRAAYPMLDMGLFKNARFTASSLSVTLVFFALFGTTFFLSQYLQSVLGYSTLESGVRVIPVAFGVMVSAPLSARLTERFGAKAIVAIGLGVVAGALGLLSTATTSSGYPLVAITEVLLGFGMGMAMTPATDSIMGAVPKENAGVGSAVNDTTRQVGGALGVAVLGSLLSTSYRSDMAGAVLGLPAPAAQAARDSVGAALQVAQQVGGRPGALLAEAARAAFISGMD